MTKRRLQAAIKYKGFCRSTEMLKGIMVLSDLTLMRMRASLSKVKHHRRVRTSQLKTLSGWAT